MPFSGLIKSDSELCNIQKESVEYVFLPFLSILIYSNIYKLHLIHFSSLYTLVKKKKIVKQKNRPHFGPIQCDPVIRPALVNTRSRSP